MATATIFPVWSAVCLLILLPPPVKPDLFKDWSNKNHDNDENEEVFPDLLPTVHPNSVLPYEPVDPDYEDYMYEEDQLDKASQRQNKMPAPTKAYEVFPPSSTSTLKPFVTLVKSPASNSKPVFVQQPQNAYIIRGQNAVLKCRVIHADKAYFTCNGEAMAASEMHKEVDKIEISESASMEAVTVKSLSLQLSRSNIEEFFGLFTCRCDAWSSKGMTSSDNATVEFAFLRKEFEVPPYSQSVELGSQIQLRCHPPVGVPKPRIYWLKDRVEVQPERDSNYIQAADGHLIIIQAREKDRANYTCVAENVANRRLSPPARLTIHVSGGWSLWSPWTDCSSNCGQGYQRRERRCDNPTPKWGGMMCDGSHVERQKCSVPCADGAIPTQITQEALDGGWSTWSPWTACSQECLRHRRRDCNQPEPLYNGNPCTGIDRDASACFGDLCRERQIPSQIVPNSHPVNEAQVEADFSLLIGLSVALAVFLIVTLTSIRILRRKGRSPSVYTMTNLNYRREFSTGNKGPSKNNGDHQTDSLLEINTNLNKDSHYNNRSTIDILKGTTINSAAAVEASPHPMSTPKLMHYDSAVPSPFLDKKQQQLLMLPNTPQLKPRAVSPANSEEHQYDIPFSHLQKKKIVHPQEIDPDYDETDHSPRQQHKMHQRRSRSSNRTSSGTSQGSSKWAKSHDQGSLLQPRLVVDHSGATPLLPRRWSGSESSLDSDPIILSSNNQDNRQSLTSCSLDPDSFTFASVTHLGATLTLPDLGVSLTIPEGALDKGYTEEVFLAVMTEGRDRPRLSDNQTLLSPVVLTGPPRLAFRKPVVLTFGHCAMSQNSWEMGVYHCDSLFADTDDTPWVKLTTVGLQQDSQVLAHVENDSCHIMTDYLSRFCLVGQSGNQVGAVKALYLLIFGQPVSSSCLDFSVSVQVTDRTPSSLEMALRLAERQGYGLLETPHIFNFYDYGQGSDLSITLKDCVAGWAMRSKNQTLSFFDVWSSGQIQAVTFNLEHVDPTVQIIAFKVGLSQVQCPVSTLNEVFNIQVDTKARLVKPLTSKKRWKIQNGLLTTASSGSTSTSSTSDNVFRLPSGLKARLCRALDLAPTKGMNDWKALAAALRLETGYFMARSSPTECVLTLWEVQQQNNTEGTVSPLVDLLNLLRVIGRQDAALIVEKEFGPWI